MPRPKGPPKEQVLIRLFIPTADKLRAKAIVKGESLPAYLARNIERFSDKL